MILKRWKILELIDWLERREDKLRMTLSNLFWVTSMVV